MMDDRLYTRPIIRVCYLKLRPDVLEVRRPFLGQSSNKSGSEESKLTNVAIVDRKESDRQLAQFRP